MLDGRQPRGRSDPVRRLTVSPLPNSREAPADTLAGHAHWDALLYGGSNTWALGRSANRLDLVTEAVPVNRPEWSLSQVQLLEIDERSW